MAERARRWRRAGAALLALTAGGIAAVAAGRFVPSPPGEAVFWCGLGALTLSFAVLCAVYLRLREALDPHRLEDAQELAAGSVRVLLPLWDGLAPALGLIDRLLEAVASLAASFPWLGGKLQALRPDEVRAVVRGLLDAGPGTRDALTRLERAIEETDVAQAQAALAELKAAAEALRSPLEVFASRDRG